MTKEPTGSLSGVALEGALWTYVARYGGRAVVFLSTLVLARVLQDPVNADLSITRGVLEKVNGQRIRGLSALDAALTEARLKGEGFLELEFSSGYVEVLDVAAAEKAHPRILRTYGVQNAKHL